MAQIDDILEEIGRILFSSALDPDIAAKVLELKEHEPQNLIDGRSVSIDPRLQPQAELLLNLLVRLEVRHGHDGQAVRDGIERPLDTLAGSSIGERLRAGASLEELRLLREAAGTMPVAKIKMWRTADRYS